MPRDKTKHATRRLKRDRDRKRERAKHRQSSMRGQREVCSHIYDVSPVYKTLVIGSGPNTVSESTVSNTELASFLALTEFRGENSVSSSWPMICVCVKANSLSFFSFFRGAQ